MTYPITISNKRKFVHSHWGKEQQTVCGDYFRIASDTLDICNRTRSKQLQIELRVEYHEYGTTEWGELGNPSKAALASTIYQEKRRFSRTNRFIQYSMRFQLSRANTSSELDQIEDPRAPDPCAVATAG